MHAGSPLESQRAIIIQHTSAVFLLLLDRSRRERSGIRADHVAILSAATSFALFTAPAVARQTALAACVPRLFTRPLVRGSLLVGCLPTFTSYLFLPHSIH